MTATLRETVFVLTEVEREVITALVEKMDALDCTDDPERFVTEAQILAGKLPDRLRRTISTFQRYGSNTGGFVIRGLPTFHVPPTPLHADHAVGSTLPATRVMSLVSALLGDQFGFKPELSGRIVQDILPVAGFERTQHSISSRSLLEPHCETAFSESRCDYVALFCLRADPEKQAETILSSIGKWFSMLDEETVAVLRQPRFVTTVDGSFLRGSGIPGPVYVGPIRVLDGGESRLRLRCDFAETRGLDARAQQAIDDLYEVACNAATSIKLEAGDLIFVDNHEAFHGRSPFTFHKDGTDRWLLRTFITKDLSKSIAHRPDDGRIIDIDYSNAEGIYPGEVTFDLADKVVAHMRSVG